MTNEREKRRISRVDYGLVCTLHCGQESYNCHIRNFSLTGLLVETELETSSTEGDSVSILLEGFCPETKLSEIQCEIVRTEGRFLGMKFSAIDYDTLMKLKNILYHVINDDDRINNEIFELLRHN